MTENPAHLLTTQALSKTFVAHNEIFNNVSIRAQRGEVVSIVGPSGCGKTTLLRILAGLDTPTSGSLQWSQSLRKAFVFQDALLLPWLNALENIRLPLKLSRSLNEKSNLANELLSSVGLSHAGHLYPHQLSGGMRMRVSLARAFVTEPEILFMDEPFAALDEITRHRLNEDLRTWVEARHLTVFFVTHSSSEAVFLSDRIYVLGATPATILDEVTIDASSQSIKRDRSFRDSPFYLQSRRTLEKRLYDKATD